MKFGTYPLSEVTGGILAHSVRLPDDTVLRKGLELDSELIDLMLAASMEEVTLAIPEPGDTLEDEAAQRIAKCIMGRGLRCDTAKTGRVNLFAEYNGLFRVDPVLVNHLNSIDPGITVATLADYSEVNKGRMVATVKIIPYGIAAASIEKIETANGSERLSLVPFVCKRIGMISTLLPGIKETVLEKTRRNLEKRLVLSDSAVEFEDRVFHLEGDITKALRKRHNDWDILVLFGASAISDSRDIIPNAIVHAGGRIIRFGMPVDPGNLLLLAEINGKPVLGAPGCARSHSENGFDWVLQRLLADIPVSPSDIAGLGVGGLLMETGARPHPREKKQGRTKIASIVLAAGQSQRMGDVNKLTAPVEGKPMVRHPVEAALASRSEDVVVVTGHQPKAVEAALVGLSCRFADNPDFAGGLSTSLATGIASLPDDISHAIVLLGDMPFVSSDDIDLLIANCRKNPDSIVMSTSSGKRGNPVLWPSSYFAELKNVMGDVGARHIIGANTDRVIEVELGIVASRDIDTPTALQKFTTPPDF